MFFCFILLCNEVVLNDFMGCFEDFWCEFEMLLDFACLYCSFHWNCSQIAANSLPAFGAMCLKVVAIFRLTHVRSENSR